MSKTHYFENNTYNTACSILEKLGYKEPLKTIVKGDRTRLNFIEGHAIYNLKTGTLGLVKY